MSLGMIVHFHNFGSVKNIEVLSMCLRTTDRLCEYVRRPTMVNIIFLFCF